MPVFWRVFFLCVLSLPYVCLTFEEDSVAQESDEKLFRESLVSPSESPQVFRQLARLGSQLKHLVTLRREDYPEPSNPESWLLPFEIHGRIFADVGKVADHDGSMEPLAKELRAADVAVVGKVGTRLSYTFNMALAGDKPRLKIAYLQYEHGDHGWTIGQFVLPNSLELQTSSRYITFMERSAFLKAFRFLPMAGLGYSHFHEHFTFEAGVFQGSTLPGISSGDRVVAVRATYGADTEHCAWMAGGSVRYRDIGHASPDTPYGALPHVHLAEKQVSFSRPIEADRFLGLEAALQVGPMHTATEWAILEPDVKEGIQPISGLKGGYVEVGWFLTGEKRPLEAHNGRWSRPSVTHPVHEGGWGAWQIAAKFDRIDLSNKGVSGGEQNSYILGLNWYLNRYLRVMMNYSHSDIEKAFEVISNGADGINSVDALAVRFQLDW